MARVRVGRNDGCLLHQDLCFTITDGQKMQFHSYPHIPRPVALISAALQLVHSRQAAFERQPFHRVASHKWAALGATPGRQALALRTVPAYSQLLGPTRSPVCPHPDCAEDMGNTGGIVLL